MYEKQHNIPRAAMDGTEPAGNDRGTVEQSSVGDGDTLFLAVMNTEASRWIPRCEVPEPFGNST